MTLSTDSIHTIVFEHSPDAIIVTNGDRVVQSVNPAFTALFGYSHEEAVGLPMSRIYADAGDYERIGRMHEGQDPAVPVRHYNIRYRRKDGSVVEAEVTARMMVGEAGRYAGHVAMVRDVSAQMRTRDLLRALVALSARTDADSASIVRQFLALGRAHFGLETGMVTRIDGTCLSIEFLDGAENGLGEGEVHPVTGTCCEAVVERGDTSSYSYPAPGKTALACFAERDIQAYIGCPLEVAGKPYGALSFLSSGLARNCPFDDDDRTLMTFLAEWLGGVLEQTAQKRALREMGEDLKLSAENFKRLYREAPAMLHSTDSAGKLLDVSDLWLTEAGYSREEVIGRPVMDFYTPEWAEASRNIMPDFWSGRHVVKNEPRSFVRKDGSIIEGEISGIVSDYPHGVGKRSMTVLVDVTERNRGRRALERNAEMFQRLYRETPAMLHSVDPDGCVVEVSDYWLMMMGYESREEVLGRPIVSFHPPEQRVRAQQCVEEFWRTGEPVWNRAYEFLRKDGTTFEVDLSVIVAKPKGESEARSLAVSFDVTERNRARRQLEEKNAELQRMSEELTRTARKFEKLYRETPAMLHSIDPQGRLVEVSDYWLRKMGYSSRDEVIGRKIAEFQSPEYRKTAGDRIARFWREGLPNLNRDIAFVRKDGSVFEAEFSVIPDGRGDEGRSQSLAVSFDVTDRNRARRDLERKHDELQRLNEELDTFASVASHDLQEPLRKIRNFADILEEELPQSLTDDGAYALGAMRAAVQRMQRLIADLLDYARSANATVAAEPVDLKQVVDRVNDDLSVAIAEAKASIRTGSLPTITGDEQQVRQLFQNLIENAVKYRDHTKRCEIDIIAEPAASKCGWRVSVRDNGIGFDQRSAEAIFLPFRRLQPRSRSSGSGLGLTICGRIAERHGWSLKAQSAPGQGSTFTLEIPAAEIGQYLSEPGSGATGMGATQSMV